MPRSTRLIDATMSEHCAFGVRRSGRNVWVGLVNPEKHVRSDGTEMQVIRLTEEGALVLARDLMSHAIPGHPGIVRED